MKTQQLKQIIRGISEKTKNRELLEKILKLTGLSRARCSEIMVYKQGSSFDHYVYKFKEETFPPSFAYLFLNAVFSSLFFKTEKGKKKKGNFYEYIKNSEQTIWQKHKDDFIRLIIDCKDLEIRKKLINPALEFHTLNLIRLSYPETKLKNESFVESYIRITHPEAYDRTTDYLEEPQYDTNDIFPSDSITKEKKDIQYQKLISNLRNFYPLIDDLRKRYMPNFIAPHEYARIRIATNEERFIGSMLFSKEFLRRDLDLTNLNNLFILKVKENNMEGSFDINDHVLIKQHPHYINLKKNIPSEVMAYNFQDGIYAIEENKRIILRRLQFLRVSGLPTENKEQFEVPEFLKEEANKEINRIFSKGTENVKLYEIDQLVHKYGLQNELLREKLKPILPDLASDNNKDIYYGKEVLNKSKKIDTVVNIISDNKKYPIHTVRFEDLLICGEVLWKSNSFKDNNAAKDIDLFKTDEDTIFDKQLLEIA